MSLSSNSRFDFFEVAWMKLMVLSLFLSETTLSMLASKYLTLPYFELKNLSRFSLFNLPLSPMLLAFLFTLAAQEAGQF